MNLKDLLVAFAKFLVDNADLDAEEAAQKFIDESKPQRG